MRKDLKEREEVGYKETPAFKNSRKKQPVEIIFKGEIIKLSHYVLRCFGFLMLCIYLWAVGGERERVYV